MIKINIDGENFYRDLITLLKGLKDNLNPEYSDLYNELQIKMTAYLIMDKVDKHVGEALNKFELILDSKLKIYDSGDIEVELSKN